MARSSAVGNGKRLATPQSVDAAVKAICDIMRRSNCAGALQYVPELTWILFLRILDEREGQEAERARAVGGDFTPSLEAPCRWRDWAAPEGKKRKELQDGTLGAVLSFVNIGLLPYLRGLRDKPGATPRQKVVGEMMSGVERTRIDTDRNFLDVLDRVHAIGHFEEFFRLLPERGDSERSWTVERKAIDAGGYDLKAVNPHAKSEEDTRTPEELLDLIEAKGREVAEAIAELRKLL